MFGKQKSGTDDDVQRVVQDWGGRRGKWEVRGVEYLPTVTVSTKEQWSKREDNYNKEDLYLRSWFHFLVGLNGTIPKHRTPD